MLLIQLVELPLHLPVIQRTHEHHDENGNHDSYSLNPFDSRLAGLMRSPKGLKQAKGQGDDCGDCEQDEDPVVVCGPC